MNEKDTRLLNEFGINVLEATVARRKEDNVLFLLIYLKDGSSVAKGLPSYLTDKAKEGETYKFNLSCVGSQVRLIPSSFSKMSELIYGNVKSNNKELTKENEKLKEENRLLRRESNWITFELLNEIYQKTSADMKASDLIMMLSIIERKNTKYKTN